MCLITLLLYFGSPSVQHPQAVHVIWPSLLRSKAWQTRSAATPPMPLLGKLLRFQWYSGKIICSLEKKRGRDQTFAIHTFWIVRWHPFWEGQWFIEIRKNDFASRRITASSWKTASYFPLWQAPDEDPFQILGTQTTCNDQLHIFKNRKA